MQVDGDLEPRVRGRPALQQQRRGAARRHRHRNLAQATHVRQRDVVQERLAGAARAVQEERARLRGFAGARGVDLGWALMASKAARWPALSCAIFRVARSACSWRLAGSEL